ncbi:MAG: hypothetical protein ABIJ18_02845 [archaeon]
MVSPQHELDIIEEDTFTEREERWFRLGEIGLYNLDVVLDYHNIERTPETEYIQTLPSVKRAKETPLELADTMLEESWFRHGDQGNYDPKAVFGYHGRVLPHMIREDRIFGHSGKGLIKAVLDILRESFESHY